MARPILQLQATDEELVELGRMARGTKVSVGVANREHKRLEPTTSAVSEPH